MLAGTAVLPLVSLAVILAGVRTGPRVKGLSIDLPATIREIVRLPGLLGLALLVLAVAMIWGTINGFFAIFGTQQLHLTPVEIGLLLGVSAVSNVISRPVLGSIIDRVRSPLVIGGVGAFGAATMLLLLPHVWGFWLPALLIFAGAPFVSAGIVAGNHGFTKVAAGGGGGAMMGVYTALSMGGQGVGPPLFAPLIQHSGWLIGFTTAGLTTAGLAAAGVLLGRRHELGGGRVSSIRPAVQDR